MDNIDEHIAFVKSQQEFHNRQAFRFRDNIRRKELHTNTAEKFKLLAEYIAKLEETIAAKSSLPKDQYRLTLTQDEVKDLPDELMSELSVSDADKADFNIIELIDNAGGVATLDRILVALYRQNGQITKRANLNARLYRMGQKALIFSVPGKKGVYSTRPLSDEDLLKLV